MINKYLTILTLSEQIKNMNEKFNAWTNKFTDNGIVASLITVGLFIILCISISHFANK